MRNAVSHHRSTKASRIGAGLLFGSLALVAAEGVASADLSERTCYPLTIPVSLLPGLPAQHTIVAELCVPSDTSRGVVVIAVHGATYSRLYWDFPYQPEVYSFVRHANDGGYATLNFDRIGTGASSRPLSPLVDVTSNAHVVHQLAEHMRSGTFGPSFSRVVLAGHSLGSIISLQEAATYHDVDGLVITGYLHTLGLGAGPGAAQFYPAPLDPAFGLFCGLDLGYLTTRPGMRDEIFYHAPTLDPAVLAMDEQTKQTVTEAELADLVLEGNPAVSLCVDAPVISIIGEQDQLFSAATAELLEPLSYTPSAELELVVLPNTGHNMNLQTNAPTEYAVIREWLDRRFPPLLP